MKTFDCYFESCGRSFPRKKKLEDHLNVHTNTRPYKCYMCEKSYTRNSHLTVHEKKHRPPSFFCGKCAYSCHTKDKMSRHEKTCVDYRCGTCKKKYKRKAWFEAHIEHHRDRSFKGTRRTHKCQYCGFVFDKKGNLVAHIQSVHHKKKIFKCVCGREYGYAASLSRHRKICDYS